MGGRNKHGFSGFFFCVKYGFSGYLVWGEEIDLQEIINGCIFLSPAYYLYKYFMRFMQIGLLLVILYYLLISPIHGKRELFQLKNVWTLYPMKYNCRLVKGIIYNFESNMELVIRRNHRSNLCFFLSKVIISVLQMDIHIPKMLLQHST